MLVALNERGRYNKQELYTKLVANLNPGQKVINLIRREDPVLFDRLSERLGAGFSTEDLFIFLQPHRSKCAACAGPLKVHKECLYFRTGFRRNYCSVKCSASAPEVRAKVEGAHLKTRGVRHVSQDKSVIAKREATNLERYGGTSTFGSKVLAEQAHATIQCRYGVEHFSKTPEWKTKVEATNRSRRGVSWPSHDPEVLERSQKSAFASKQVTIKGSVHIVQGYEPEVLRFLEKDIRKLYTKPSEMPRLDYRLDGKSRRYFPDAVLLTTSGAKVLLEVKSVYTVRANVDKDVAKFLAAIKWCSSNSHTFTLAVADHKGNISLFTPTCKKDLRKIFTQFTPKRI